MCYTKEKGGLVMGCKFKIKEARQSLTGTEQRIADYILEHQEETIHASAQSMGDVTKTSAAALIRFSKKLGYSGFTALKVDLAKDGNDVSENFNELIAQDDNIETLIRKSQSITQQCLEQTYQLINVRSLQCAIDALIRCRNIYLYGVGGSGIVCEDLMQKLTRINRSVVYHSDMHVQIACTAHINSDDVAIAISYSGETQDINTAIKYAQSVGAATIAITQFNAKSTLSKLANIVLNTPVQERELRLGSISSRNASLILTDLLYYGVAKENLERTKDNLVKTRELIHEIQ